VQAQLDKYTNILGSEDAAYYVLSENNGYELDKAPNGQPSKLFSDLLSHYNGDEVQAIKAKAKLFTESFKNWFGDWLSDDKTNVSKVVDENGEPLVAYHGSDYAEDLTQVGDWSENALPYATYFAIYEYASFPHRYAAYLNIRNPRYEHFDLTEDAIQNKNIFDKYIEGYDGFITGKEGINSPLDSREIVVIDPN